jgi:hypothetical protein
MLDELAAATKAYFKKWQTLVEGRGDKAFFASLKPTAVGWKTEDQADFDRRFTDLREHCDQIHFGWINERWIAVLHLKDSQLTDGITLVKLMQRRPGSTDATGLDHVDFYSPPTANVDQILGKESGLKWTHEENVHCKWVSLWFDGTEAKLRTDTTLDVCIRELEEVKENLLS